MLPKFLQNIIDGFKIDQVLSWSKEIIYFYIIPRRFFRTYFSKDYLTQVYQVVFYTIIFVGLNWLLNKDDELKGIYKSAFGTLLLTIPFVGANCISLLIIARSELKLWKVFSFVYITWLLFIYPIIICGNLFFTSENYTFYFLINILNTIAFLYSLFLIWHVLFDKVRKIVLGYLINIVLINVSFVIIAIVLVDSYSNSKIGDPILNELQEVFTNIKTYEGKPYTYVEEYYPKIKSKNRKISFMKNDTAFYYEKNHVDYYKQLSENNSRLLDSLTFTVKFQRSKDILLELSQYFKLMSTYFDYPPCDTCLIEHIVYKSRRDSTIEMVRKEYIIDAPYLKHYKIYESKLKEINELYEYATSPQYLIGLLTMPTEFIFKLFNFEERQVDVSVYLG
jgi:hypothetical protein